MHPTRVPLQRRHAFAGRHVPHLDLTLEILVVPPRHDASPVWKHGNAVDLRRRHIITKVQQKVNAARRTLHECPSSVATHLPVATSHTLSVWSCDPDTTRRPSGNTATLETYDKDRSSQKYSGTPQRTLPECPSSVATHLPVATSHTLSVLSPADTTRRPSGKTATQLTYDEARSSQKYSGRRNARSSSALSASPRTCRSPRPTP